MSDRRNDLPTSIAVVVVTFTDPVSLQEYEHSAGVTFPILTDPSRGAYRAYGLGRGTIGRVWGPKAARRYLDIFKQSGIKDWRRPTEDTLQLGDDFVISPTGTLAWGHWGKGPDDRPAIEKLIQAARKATA